MPAELLMGVDIGTYASKAVLTTAGGTILAEQTVEHGMSIPRPGWAEHDPERVWWGEFAMLSRALLDSARVTGPDVAGVGVSAIGPCLVPVGPNHRALRPGILYGVDTRSVDEIAYLDSRYGAENMVRVGGSTLTTQAVGPKILWLRRHEPEIFQQATSFHSAGDYIVLRLTGEQVMDSYTASSYNPLFDLERGTWTDAFAGEIIDPDRLPPVRAATEIAGEVTPEAARETGLAPGTPVTVGAVDAVAEAVSVGAIHPGDLMFMYGTTTFFILASDQPLRHPAMWAVRHAFPDTFGLAAGMATTGALTRWFRDNFARDLPTETAYETLAGDAGEIPPGSMGLVVLPYFSGERTPINDAEARGVICGLTLAHDRAHVYRALLEATGYGIRHNLESMRGAGAEIRRIVAVGGGTRNPVWLQIVSDISAAPQEVPAQTIGAAYGDAFLAGLATGIIPSLASLHTDWVHPDRIVEPIPENVDRYEPYYEIYRGLYSDTLVEQHRLARLGNS